MTVNQNVSLRTTSHVATQSCSRAVKFVSNAAVRQHQAAVIIGHCYVEVQLVDCKIAVDRSAVKVFVHYRVRSPSL